MLSTSKAPLDQIIIRRAGLASPIKVRSFCEADLVLDDWVKNSPKKDELEEVTLFVMWKNGGSFNLGIFLDHKNTSKTTDTLGCLKYLINFALGEETNPKWTPEENAKALLKEQQIGAADHCRLVRETCLLDNLPLH